MHYGKLYRGTLNGGKKEQSENEFEVEFELEVRVRVVAGAKHVMYYRETHICHRHHHYELVHVRIFSRSETLLLHYLSLSTRVCVSCAIDHAINSANNNQNMIQVILVHFTSNFCSHNTGTLTCFLFCIPLVTPKKMFVL